MRDNLAVLLLVLGMTVPLSAAQAQTAQPLTAKERAQKDAELKKKQEDALNEEWQRQVELKLQKQKEGEAQQNAQPEGTTTKNQPQTNGINNQSGNPKAAYEFYNTVPEGQSAQAKSDKPTGSTADGNVGDGKNQLQTNGTNNQSGNPKAAYEFYNTVPGGQPAHTESGNATGPGARGNINGAPKVPLAAAQPAQKTALATKGNENSKGATVPGTGQKTILPGQNSDGALIWQTFTIMKDGQVQDLADQQEVRASQQKAKDDAKQSETTAEQNKVKAEQGEVVTGSGSSNGSSGSSNGSSTGATGVQAATAAVSGGMSGSSSGSNSNSGSGNSGSSGNSSNPGKK